MCYKNCINSVKFSFINIHFLNHLFLFLLSMQTYYPELIVIVSCLYFPITFPAARENMFNVHKMC